MSPRRWLKRAWGFGFTRLPEAVELGFCDVACVATPQLPQKVRQVAGRQEPANLPKEREDADPGTNLPEEREDAGPGTLFERLISAGGYLRSPWLSRDARAAYRSRSRFRWSSRSFSCCFRRSGSFSAASCSCALAASSIFVMSGAYWLGWWVPGRRTISSSAFASVRSRSGSLCRSLLLSQLAKLLAQILGLDAVVGCFLALLDGLLAVETAGDDLGHLGEAIAGQGEIFGPLDPPAEVEGLALDRVGRLGDFLIVGLAVAVEGGVFGHGGFCERGVRIAKIVVLAEADCGVALVPVGVDPLAWCAAPLVLGRFSYG